MAYTNLFREGQIGPLTLKNRGIMMPMATELADKDGLTTPEQIRYYQERAKGGVAMIIHEYIGVDDEDSIAGVHNLRVARDYHISALEKLTDAVHMYDSYIIAQLHHGGATSNPALTNRQNIAPSSIPIADGRPVPREMSLEDIRRVQQKFIDAAIRCKKAGYDGVELHGAHGYLIAQFFSKYYNRRRDAYGGSVENRCRFLKEIIDGIREKLGKYPILVRMCGDEMTPTEGFLSLEESLEIGKYLEVCGIDALNISVGSARNGDANCEPFSYQSGWKKHVAKAFKEALSIPVIATNTIKDPDFAEALLQEGVCDFVGLGRSQLADPYFMKKAKEGKTELIRKCTGCLYCRERVIGNGLSMRCSVNACTGRETELSDLVMDGANRSAAVVGGGPAGMEAARVLAMRGFRVSLYEKEKQLGGTLNLADKAPYKDKLTGLTETLSAQLRALSVEIRLGVTATPELLEKEGVEGVVLAVGAKPIVPEIPGINGRQVVLAEEIISGEKTVSGKIVIVGSGLTGLEVGQILLNQGKNVIFVEMQDQLGPGIFPNIRNDELSRILPKKPEVYTGHRLIAVEEGNVKTLRLSDKETVTTPADSIVLALGSAPDPGIRQAYEPFFDKVILAGDAKKAGKIATAIRQGYEAGYRF